MGKHFIRLLACWVLIAMASESLAQEKHKFFIPFDRADFPSEVNSLETLLEESNIEIQGSDYWHPYQRGVRQGAKGLYLVAPHFASWLIHYHQFSVVTQLNQSIQYVVAVRKRDIHIFEIDDLDQKEICTQRALNIDFLLLRSIFSNPLLAADHIAVSDVLKEMQSANSECQGFILPNHLFKQHVEEKLGFIRLHQGQVWPAYAVVAHPDMSETDINSLRSLLLNMEAIKPLEQMLNRLSLNPRFVRASGADYPESLADGLLFNWQKSPTP